MDLGRLLQFFTPLIQIVEGGGLKSHSRNSVHVVGGGLSVPRSLLFLILQLMIGPLIVVGPEASAQVTPCLKAALIVIGIKYCKQLFPWL